MSRHVLITGADGFIGSHLVESCLEKGYRVKAFVFYNAFNSWGWLDGLDGEKLANIEVFAGDVRDPHGVDMAVRGVDLIFHLAALIGIPFSYHSPDAYVDTNIRGTLNILQAARNHSIQKVIITSTSEVYGTAEYVPIDERHPLKAQSPYAATKIAAERLAESFHRSFGTPAVIVRPFNTYGPRQSLRAVIPAIITQAMDGKKTLNLGALHPTRDFNYVKDTCNGFIEIANSDRVVGKTLNIASGREISIAALAEKIIDAINPQAAIVCDQARLRPKNSEVERLLGANRKILELTDWQPAVDLDAGLGGTIDWFRRNRHLYNLRKGTYYR